MIAVDPAAFRKTIWHKTLQFHADVVHQQNRISHVNIAQFWMQCWHLHPTRNGCNINVTQKNPQQTISACSHSIQKWQFHTRHACSMQTLFNNKACKHLQHRCPILAAVWCFTQQLAMTHPPPAIHHKTKQMIATQHNTMQTCDCSLFLKNNMNSQFADNWSKNESNWMTDKSEIDRDCAMWENQIVFWTSLRAQREKQEMHDGWATFEGTRRGIVELFSLVLNPTLLQLLHIVGCIIVCLTVAAQSEGLETSSGHGSFSRAVGQTKSFCCCSGFTGCCCCNGAPACCCWNSTFNCSKWDVTCSLSSKDVALLWSCPISLTLHLNFFSSTRWLWRMLTHQLADWEAKWHHKDSCLQACPRTMSPSSSWALQGCAWMFGELPQRANHCSLRWRSWSFQVMLQQCPGCSVSSCQQHWEVRDKVSRLWRCWAHHGMILHKIQHDVAMAWRKTFCWLLVVFWLM